MKIKTLSALLMLSMFCLLISCKKSSPVTNSNPAYVGLWKGKYGGGTNYPTNGYAMLFRNNGTFRVFGGTDTLIATLKGEGTYTVSNGTTINGSYTYPDDGGTYSISATLNSNNTFLEGTWGNAPSNSNGGMFFMVKQ